MFFHIFRRKIAFPHAGLCVGDRLPVNAQTEPTAQCPEEERRPTGGFSKHSWKLDEGAGWTVEFNILSCSVTSTCFRINWSLVTASVAILLNAGRGCGSH